MAGVFHFFNICVLSEPCSGLVLQGKMEKKRSYNPTDYFKKEIHYSLGKSDPRMKFCLQFIDFCHYWVMTVFNVFPEMWHLESLIFVKILPECCKSCGNLMEKGNELYLNYEVDELQSPL